MSTLSDRLSPTTQQFPNAVHYGTAFSALLGVALWALQTYAYPHIPGAVQAEIPILLPAALGYVVALFVRHSSPPTELSATTPLPPLLLPHIGGGSGGGGSPSPGQGGSGAGGAG